MENLIPFILYYIINLEILCVGRLWYSRIWKLESAVRAGVWRQNEAVNWSEEPQELKYFPPLGLVSFSVGQFGECLHSKHLKITWQLAGFFVWLYKTTNAEGNDDDLESLRKVCADFWCRVVLLLVDERVCSLLSFVSMWTMIVENSLSLGISSHQSPAS